MRLQLAANASRVDDAVKGHSVVLKLGIVAGSIHFR
jgi:hypothetical protein